MARPLRPAPAPSTNLPASSSSTSTPKTATSTPRASGRPRHPSASASTAPSTPYTPGPQTPSDIAHRHIKPSTVVEAKAHGLRSVGGASEKTPCPFPGSWGGREKCGLAEEDETDEVLMGVLGAIASLDNRALSAEEIASTCFQQGWLRPPSAAIEPTTLINNAIRGYLKRCERSKRHCLLAKQQLAGSVVESVLEPALHPEAFSSPIRPKGTVWYLLSAGAKTGRWKNPFDGLEVPKLPPRKPANPAKKQLQKDKENKVKVDGKEKRSSSSSSKGKGKLAGPVKIRLVVNGAGGGDDESASDIGSSSRSRSRSIGLGSDVMPITQSPPPILKRTKPRRVKDILDSSSDSDTSDSDMDMDGPLQSRFIRPARPLRKGPPTPISLGGSPRVGSLSRIPQHSPFMDLFISPVLPSMPPFAPPHSSPFPSHSLDNTTWTARHDRLNRFETSSSSSDDDLRDPEWGIASDIMMKSPECDEITPWNVDDDEAKVKEATDALRVLFPMSSIDDEVDLETRFELNRLDNRPLSSSDLSSLADSSSAGTVQPAFGQLRALDAGVIPLNAWLANSSPVASPNLKFQKNLLPAPDVSPTQHLSKLSGSFDPAEIEVDDEAQWLDESGELPVKAEDTLSDIDLNSTIGDAPTPEHDRQLHTALWAQEAAAIRIKQEPEDYPSPATTDPDDQSATGYLASRASSTPSSGSSELPPFEIDIDNGRMNIDEVILGPESISVEELDGWLPSQGKAERTPHRGRPVKNRHHPSRCSGNWGGIGVCNSLANIVKPLVRNKSTRSNATARRRQSSPQTPHVIQRLVSPETDNGDGDGEEEVEVDDAIGTEDLEKARVEAEAKEEQHRKACKEKAEQRNAAFEAYRQTFGTARAGAGALGENQDLTSEPSPSPWIESPSSQPWGSHESLNSLPTSGALSPMSLHGHGESMSMSMGMAVDPKALLSPPLHRGFGISNSPNSNPMMAWSNASANTPTTGQGQAQQGTDVNMAEPIRISGAGPISPAVPPPTLKLPKAVSVSPKGKSKNRPISPASAPTSTSTPIALVQPAPALPPTLPVPSSAPIVVSPTPSTTLSAQVAPVSTSSPAVPSSAGSKTTEVPPKSTPSPLLVPQTQTSTPSVPAVSTVSTPTSATSSSAPSAATSTNGNGNGNRSGGKIATITKPLCPGVDACVVDNIPVYAHIFDGKQGPGKQVLLRRLDTDFVNANALLHALGVPEKKHVEYLDHPLSAIRLAARHPVPPSSAGAEYSQGVSGIWVHLSEARDFAKRAKLQEGSLLSSLLREDLFQLFAALAGLKPDHALSETFGLPFVPRRNNLPVPTSSTLSATNSKSAPNLSALSSSAPATHPRTSPLATAPPTTTGTGAGCVKGPLVRTAPNTPPDGCPQPKRRRNTVSVPASPLSGSTTTTATATANAAGPKMAAATTTTVNSKPNPNSGSGIQRSQTIALAPAPASGTRQSVAAAKRSTRGSIGGINGGVAKTQVNSIK